MSNTTSAPSTQGIRKPYHGSCHCGYTRYITYLTLPPPLITTTPPTPTSTHRIRKCNCSTCHKMNFFHLRLMDAPNDFLLLSPSDPFTDLSDYTCFENRIHWFFCGKCGVRCFSLAGEGQRREVEVEGEDGGKEEKMVWAPKREGWVEGQTGYLSINAVTLESGQEGLDLREWTEKNWIAYLDAKDKVGDNALGTPF